MARDLALAFLKAGGKLIESRGGKAIIVGGIRVEKNYPFNSSKYRLVMDFLGSWPMKPCALRVRPKSKRLVSRRGARSGGRRA